MQYETGARRDNDHEKVQPALISPFFIYQLGQVMRYGAYERKQESGEDGYGPRNWEKGIPESRLIGSGFRHLLAIMMGDRSEDHVGQLGFAVMALSHTREMVRRGLLPRSLLDWPTWDPTEHARQLMAHSVQDQPVAAAMYPPGEPAEVPSVPMQWDCHTGQTDDDTDRDDQCRAEAVRDLPQRATRREAAMKENERDDGTPSESATIDAIIQQATMLEAARKETNQDDDARSECSGTSQQGRGPTDRGNREPSRKRPNTDWAR